MKIRKFLALVSGFALLLSVMGTFPAIAASGVTRQIPSGGTTSLQTGYFTPSSDSDVTEAEFPGQEDEADGSPGTYPGTITNRSNSISNGHGKSAQSSKKVKPGPVFQTGFQGLNLYQQRYARGGNQFTVEPPDQALCVGNGFVVEAVNDVLNVYNTSGQSVLPDNTSTNVVAGLPRDVNHAVDLNSFYGYAPAIDRATGIRAQFVTDPSCLYDAQTQRFFVVVLTLESFPNGAFTHENHIDIAVSQTPDPTGLWTIYRVDVTNDGSSNPVPANACPCLGDYPHIGADANGFYVTTNAYPWATSAFNGAQIYAFSKAQLAANAASVTMVHIDTWGAVNAPSDAGSTQPGFTVWPAISPGANSFDTKQGGAEYFLSSNAADEATRPIAGTGGPATSTQLVVWSLKNTASLNSATPALSLTNKILTVGQYGVPPKQRQPGSGTPPTTAAPQGYCINDSTTVLFNGQVGCWRLLLGAEPAHDEVISRPDSNDSRMQQVMFANGNVWGALDTALNPDGGPQRAGIEWFVVKTSDGGKIVKQGYLGTTGYDLTYPAVAVTANGKGVMVFTATGDNLNPSAAMTSIDAQAGVGPWSVINGGGGGGQDDGFTSYKSQVGNPPRTRWGDYSAAFVDGNFIWLATEYTSAACGFTAWGGPFFQGGSGDNLLGTCAASAGAPGTRTALGNWATHMSEFRP